jgi:hypothetical protein
VQFLAHGDGGKYQKSFEQFTSDVSQGRDAIRAFEKNLGDIESFELKWKRYWTSVPEDPTRDVYAKAVTAILNSYLSRATKQGQTFKSFEDFASAGKNEQVQASNEEWLPPQLLKEGIKGAELLQKKGVSFTITDGQVTCKP